MCSDVARVEVARFRDLPPSSRLFRDASIPGYERTNYMVMGEVGEDPETRAAIPSADLHLGIVECAPGTGAALHSHPTVEVFMALSGYWAIRWGDEGENEVVLEPFDAVAVPAGAMRGFRNVGTEEAHLLAVLTGRDAGEITWHPSVVEEVEKRQAT